MKSGREDWSPNEYSSFRNEVLATERPGQAVSPSFAVEIKAGGKVRLFLLYFVVVIVQAQVALQLAFVVWKRCTKSGLLLHLHLLYIMDE